MANNRLYIQDTETGERYLLAKGFGGLWSASGDADSLHDWLNSGNRDRAASEHGATKLRLVTEDTLHAEEAAAKVDYPPEWEEALFHSIRLKPTT